MIDRSTTPALVAEHAGISLAAAELVRVWARERGGWQARYDAVHD